ncbi:hypothetical protein CVT24_012347 [Panaeolus cyanescens]|uniref:Uncharacterized protein n=1 Tax=Panaeolus cyanescens TaxID=181874 RepID=A0A409W6G5_9AGAR|nr:hypothetical protein CVT24_012347 [Panaeolus cyanescens]
MPMLSFFIANSTKCRGVNVALSPKPPAPPRSSQSGTLTFSFPQGGTTSNNPTPTPPPAPPTTSVAPSRSPSASQSTLTSISSTPSSTSRDSLLNRSTNTTPAQHTDSSFSSPASSTTTASVTPPDSNVIGPDLNAGFSGSENERSSLPVPTIVGVTLGVSILVIAIVAFFLMYIRRLRRKRNGENYPEVQEYVTSMENRVQTRWGPPPLNPNRRNSDPSSQYTTTSLISSPNATVVTNRKGWSGPNPGPVAPHEDDITSSDIYVRHEDSGVVISPSVYDPVELPPDYAKLRNPTS